MLATTVVVICHGHLRIERLPTSVPVTAAAVAAAASQMPARRGEHPGSRVAEDLTQTGGGLLPRTAAGGGRCGERPGRGRRWSHLIFDWLSVFRGALFLSPLGKGGDLNEKKSKDCHANCYCCCCGCCLLMWQLLVPSINRHPGKYWVKPRLMPPSLRILFSGRVRR